MIVFLNFAPIHYMGGAERKIYELYCNTSKYEQSHIITANKSLASLYGKTVLNLSFEDRSKGKLKLNKNDSTQLSFLHFMPFTNNWRSVKNKINNARVVYLKSEVLEFLVLIYFGGFKVLQKTIAGVRSPLIYPTPIGFFDNLHNFVYKSRIAKFILKRVKLIHVLNIRDKNFFEQKFELSNIVHIPNYIESLNSNSLKKVKVNKKELKIIFIGEIITRKGVDTLIKVISLSPKEYRFDIVGDGPRKNEIIQLTKKYNNCTYYGYLEKKKIFSLLNENDVLFFPSLAEGFGNVIIEAMSQGLKIVDSKNIELGLPKYIEYSGNPFDVSEYTNLFENIYREKKSNKDFKKQIQKYCSEYYNFDKIMPELLYKLFKIKSDTTR